MGMPAEQQTPGTIAEGYVSLFEILDAFGAPMSEEHAWALAFQACKTLQRLWLAHRNAGNATFTAKLPAGRERSDVKRSDMVANSNNSTRVYLIENLKDLRICQDGTVHPSSADMQGPQSGTKTRPRKMATTEQQLVQSVGVVLFRALDFRLGPDEQRSLSPAMDLLLDKMTSAGDVESHDLHNPDGIRHGTNSCTSNSNNNKMSGNSSSGGTGNNKSSERRSNGHHYNNNSNNRNSNSSCSNNSSSSSNNGNRLGNRSNGSNGSGTTVGSRTGVNGTSRTGSSIHTTVSGATPSSRHDGGGIGQHHHHHHHHHRVAAAVETSTDGPSVNRSATRITTTTRLHSDHDDDDDDDEDDDEDGDDEGGGGGGGGERSGDGRSTGTRPPLATGVVSGSVLFHRNHSEGEDDDDNDSDRGGRNSAVDSEGAYDEGIHDVELDDETRSGSPDDVEHDGLTLDKVIQMCSAHMSLGNQADSHYRAVCRAFVAEWLELTTFLREVSKGTKELRSKSYELCATGGDDDVCSNLDELGFQDWARLWVQVIRELRQGVVLKKVRLDHPPQTEPSIEYELTPYEMLLDDIRSRRYKLNKVMVNGELPPRVKKDAFALILEFIRSRPPLVPVGKRRLKQLPPKEPALHERLMDAIRQQHRLRHVTTRYSSILDYGWSFGSDTCSGGLSLSSTATNESEEGSPSFQIKSSSQNFSQRRLIHVDLMFSDDELEDSESNASSLTKHPSIEFLSTSTSSSSSPSQHFAAPVIEHQSLPANLLRRRVSRLSWQKSTVAQQNDPSVAAARSRKLWRRHSIDVCDAEHQEKLVRSDPFRRSIRVRQEIVVGNPVSSDANGHADTKDSTAANKIAIVNKQLECLSLTLEEVAHIRSVMTKAELETLLVTPQLYEDVAKSKVCFTCRKSRFNVLFSRPVKCHLCERSVCDKCSTKMHIPTHRFDRIPVYMLSPSTPTEEITPEVSAYDKRSRNRKKDDIETAVQTFTSGSAPSSPNIGSRLNGTTMVCREAATEFAADSCETHVRSLNHDAGELTDNGRKRKSWQDSLSKGLLKRPSILRVRAKLRGSAKPPSQDEEAKSQLCEKLKAPVLPVCRDCKYLVRSIILSNRNPIVKSHSDNSSAN